MLFKLYVPITSLYFSSLVGDLLRSILVSSAIITALFLVVVTVESMVSNFWIHFSFSLS